MAVGARDSDRVGVGDGGGVWGTVAVDMVVVRAVVLGVVIVAVVVAVVAIDGVVAVGSGIAMVVMKRGARVGAASVKRRREGGVLALGRDSTTRDGYLALRAALVARSGGYDEIMGRPLLGTDVAHVIARSQGGDDSVWNCLWLARATHRLMEAPYAKGRLIVSRVVVKGVRGFDWEYVSAADKWAYRRGEFIVLKAGFVTA